MKIIEYYSYYDQKSKEERLTTEPISSTRGEKLYYLTPEDNKILYNPEKQIYSLGVFVSAFDRNPWVEQDTIY
jgi:hypothetical protein